MTTPGGESCEQPPKKKKKKAPKGMLSFGDNEDEVTNDTSTPAGGTPRSRETRSPDPASRKSEEATSRRLTPNPHSLIPAPKVVTKATLQAEASTRDKLRKEFLAIQESVRDTEILIPFVFYDGTNIPGGVVKVKKGDSIWLFLERCRKVGARLGVMGRGGGRRARARSKSDSRREWARVGVDDLLCVRGEVIVPHVRRAVPPFSNKD